MPGPVTNASDNQTPKTTSIPNQKIDLNQRLLAELEKRSSNEEDALELIEKGHINLEEKELCGTILVLAASKGYTKIVQTLILKGIDVNYRNKEDKSALDSAAWTRKTDTVKFLLEKKAQINATSKNNETALHIAAKAGNLEIVELLVKNGAEINAASNDNYTALHLAVKEAHFQIVELLVKNGADITINNGKYQKKALNLAEDAIKALPDTTDTNHNQLEDLDQITIEIKEALDKIIKLLKKEEKEQQYKKELVDNIKSISSDNTLSKDLFAAVRSRDIEKVKSVINKLKEKAIGIDSQNEDGDTALTLAAFIGRTDMVRLLLENGSDIIYRNNKDKSALDLAAGAGNINTVKLLLDNKAEIDAKSKNNETALHLAAKAGHFETVALLVARGADITIRRNETSFFSSKKTPLDLAKDANQKKDKSDKSKNAELDKIIALLKEKQKELKEGKIEEKQKELKEEKPEKKPEEERNLLEEEEKEYPSTNMNDTYKAGIINIITDSKA